MLLLGLGGRTVYSGPSRCTLPYFSTLGFTIEVNSNPADFFIDVIAGNVERTDVSKEWGPDEGGTYEVPNLYL